MAPQPSAGYVKQEARLPVSSQYNRSMSDTSSALAAQQQQQQQRMVVQRQTGMVSGKSGIA